MSSSYRSNVAAILRRGDGKILVAERMNFKHAWQFPQGGVDKGEDLIAQARTGSGKTAVFALALLATRLTVKHSEMKIVDRADRASIIVSPSDADSLQADHHPEESPKLRRANITSYSI